MDPFKKSLLEGRYGVHPKMASSAAAVLVLGMLRPCKQDRLSA